MVSTIIAQRYAKALLEVAAAEGVEDRLMGEVSALAEALGDGDADVRRFLSEPLSSAEDKLGVLLSSFPEAPHALFKSFLKTVMENGRERFLPLMLKEFLKLSREARGQMRGEISTAFKLDDSQKRLIETQLSDRLQRKVELIPVVDRQVIGGAVLRLGDTVYDGSLRQQLKRLEERLRQEPARRDGGDAEAKKKSGLTKKAAPKAKAKAAKKAPAKKAAAKPKTSKKPAPAKKAAAKKKK
jgi:F-type H+-transporting ATPase subunit delta